MAGELFGAANDLPYNSNATSKVIALAADYFKQGKSIEWVLENAVGKSKPLRKAVISLAEGNRVITKKQADALREQYQLSPKKKGF